MTGLRYSLLQFTWDRLACLLCISYACISCMNLGLNAFNLGHLMWSWYRSFLKALSIFNQLSLIQYLLVLLIYLWHGVSSYFHYNSLFSCKLSVSHVPIRWWSGSYILHNSGYICTYHFNSCNRYSRSTTSIIYALHALLFALILDPEVFTICMFQRSNSLLCIFLGYREFYDTKVIDNLVHYQCS